ncbi:MAG: hypothetical protein ACI4OP_04460 [Candidatus Coprovivens sp.]
MKKVEDNEKQVSTRQQLSKLDEYRTKFIDTKIQRNKEFAIVAGAVAAVSATTVLGNIIVPNYQIAAQNSGTLIAMVAYSLGNFLMYRKAKQEKEIVLSNPEEEINLINILRNKLELLKNRVAYDKLQQATMATASAGFITSFISSLFMQPTNVEAANTLAVVSAAMAGAVGVASAMTAYKQNKLINYYKEEITGTEAQLKLAEAIEEAIQEPIVEEQGTQKTLK